MIRRSRTLTWFHLSLLLGERILALRSSQGGGQEEASLGEVQSNGTAPERARGATPPPKPVKGGCRDLKTGADRCPWLQCKHEEYKTALERKKYESEVEAGVNFTMRDTPSEEPKIRSAEGRFLAVRGTQTLLHKIMLYIHRGRHCEWALDSAKFEGWLETLLPSRSRCVKEVIRRFEPDEENCAEGFTNNFKKELLQNCKDVNGLKRHLAADKSVRNLGQVWVIVGGWMFMAGSQILVFASIALPLIGFSFFAAGLAVLSLVGLVALVDLLCKQKGKNWERIRANLPKRRSGK